MSNKKNEEAGVQSREALAGTEEATGKAGMLGGPKTQLALGAAATLGIMLLYRLGKKTLATQDPESYLAIEKVKAALKENETERRKEARRERERENERRAGERRSKARDDGST